MNSKSRKAEVDVGWGFQQRMLSGAMLWGVGSACLAGSWLLLMPLSTFPIAAGIAAIGIGLLLYAGMACDGAKANIAMRTATLVPWLLSGPLVIGGPWLGSGKLPEPEKALMVGFTTLWLVLTAIHWFSYTNWRAELRAASRDGTIAPERDGELGP